MEMSVHNAMRSLRPASVLFTGGAAFYLASDGGDMQVLRKRSEKAREQIDNTMTSTFGEDTLALIREQIDKLKAAVPLYNRVTASTSAPELIEPETEQPPEDMTGESGHASNMEPTRRGSVLCHTCSGPRLWYLADKFRIKRRIGPPRGEE